MALRWLLELGMLIPKKLIDNTKPNSLILLHERCDLTVEVLTEYIEYCLLEGYTFVTLKTNHEV